MLLSRGFVANFGDKLSAAAKAAGIEPEIQHLPDDPQARLPAAECDRIEIALLTRDARFSPLYPSFGDTLVAARNLKWVHFVSAAIDQHAFLPALVARNVTLTTSAGTNGEPVGQHAICGLLMLARGFPRWLDAQRRHAWEPTRGANAPRDLAGQTVAIVGLGAIGTTVARFCQAVGMHVIGVRRRHRQVDDPVDEMHAFTEFSRILPRCDWVVLACPLTDDTRHLLNAGTLARLPKGACVMNVARGGCIDEAALIEALQNGHLGGAYLDVFENEPLAADSPLWDLPNVICTPHSAAVSAGNEGRAAEIFFENLVLWARGRALHNERHA